MHNLRLADLQLLRKRLDRRPRHAVARIAVARIAVAVAAAKLQQQLGGFHGRDLQNYISDIYLISLDDHGFECVRGRRPPVDGSKDAQYGKRETPDP